MAFQRGRLLICVNCILTPVDDPYKENFQNQKDSQISGVPQTSMQVISFYEKSSTDFRITLDQLDKNLRDLVDNLKTLQDPSVASTSCKLLLTLNYLQSSNLKANTKREEKTFRTEIQLRRGQINQIIQMYSVIRNIGSTNPERVASVLSSIQLEFEAGVVDFELQLAH